MSDEANPADQLGKIVRAFINIRDARAALKSDFDAQDKTYKDSQAKLEGAMLEHLNRHGMEAVRTEAGTFYKQEDIKPSGGDWEALYAWIKEHDAWDALERRIKKTFISEYMEAHQGGLPPGVNVHREYVVRVRKA